MESEYYPFVLTPSDGTDNVSVSGQISIPQNATIGLTRMRIIKDLRNVYEPGEFDACLNAYYGQVEDYSVNIQTALSNPDNSQTTFSVYPNTTKNRVFIESRNQVELATLLSVNERILKTSESSEMDLNGLASGIYLLKIQFENGQKNHYQNPETVNIANY